MKLKLIILSILFFGLDFAHAQDEFVGPINGNFALKRYESIEKSFFNSNNIIYNADTLSLPFVDDFSTNTLLPYNLSPSQIYDSVLFASGTCVLNADFVTTEVAVMVNQSYIYFYDTLLDVIDSFASMPIQVDYFNNANCFPNISSSTTFWPQTYNYTFDSLTGAKIDSTIILADSILAYAKIYFASLDPNTKWIDNYAFINNTFPVNPITIGVATLDGLNEFGRPYNQTVVNALGQADYLTSKPIDLSGLTNDSALFISFFVEAQGLGDIPNSQDSLVLEFKNEYENTWVKAWGITINNIAPNEFKQYYVAIRDTNLVVGPRYFYPDFQFRFRNIASISGNNDHWHIDYVRLDKNRVVDEQDTVIRDVAFMYDFPNPLENYSMLPWSQFQAGADQFADSIFVSIRDNGQINGVSAGSFPISLLVTDSFDLDTIYQLNGLNFNPTSEIKNQSFNPNLDFVKPSFESDSVCINSVMGISPLARNFLSSNDTIYNRTCFEKVMAYDDGSAEKTFGVIGSVNEVKKFAYKFEVAHPDTLAAIQIHFSNIDVNVNDLVFSFYAWDSLEVDVPLSYENVIGVIENKKPSYVNERNGFVTFAFDTPILVTNTFYIGWAQTDTRNLQVGFDKNSTKGRENMFTYVNSTWRPSTIQENGSPMIRAVLDANFVFDTISAVREIAINNHALMVYPNPTNGRFTIQLPTETNSFFVHIFDYSGRKIQSAQDENKIDISEFPAGVYFIQTIIKGDIYYSKIIKQ